MVCWAVLIKENRRGMIGYSRPLEVRAQARSICKEEGCGMEELYVQRPCG
jgi:hypothetical protein